jgi:hypothetical protein
LQNNNFIDNLKEVPAELSATSLPQQWHMPRGRKIKPQAIVSMTWAQDIDQRVAHLQNAKI